MRQGKSIWCCLAVFFLALGCVPEALDPLEQGMDTTEFTGTLEFIPLTKTILDKQTGSIRSVLWADNDSLRINGRLYKVSSLSAGGRTAKFTALGTAASPGQFKAWYPAAVYNGGNPTLPAVQYYRGTNGDGKPVIGHLPMYAETTTASLEFKNICAVLSFEITGSMPVDSVVVTSKKNPLCGKIGSVDASGKLTMATKDTKKRVKLDCSAGGGVALDPDNPTEFFVAVPPGSYPHEDLLVNVYSGTTLLTTLTQNGAKTLERSNVYAFEMDMVVESMQMVISTNSSIGRTFQIPFDGIGNSLRTVVLPSEILVDWGDGSDPELYPKGHVFGTDDVKHTYASSRDGRETTITITSWHRAGTPSIPKLDFYWNPPSYQFLQDIPTPLLMMECQYDSASWIFGRCSLLTSISTDLFVKNPHIKSFSCAFQECSGLTSIPEGLFDGNPAVTNFDSTFEACTSLTRFLQP